MASTAAEIAPGVEVVGLEVQLAEEPLGPEVPAPAEASAPPSKLPFEINNGTSKAELEGKLAEAGWEKGPMRNGQGTTYTSPDGRYEIRIGDEGRDGQPYAKVQDLKSRNYLTVEGIGPSSSSRETDRILTHFSLVEE